MAKSVSYSGTLGLGKINCGNRVIGFQIAKNTSVSGLTWSFNQAIAAGTIPVPFGNGTNGPYTITVPNPITIQRAAIGYTNYDFAIASYGGTATPSIGANYTVNGKIVIPAQTFSIYIDTWNYVYYNGDETKGQTDTWTVDANIRFATPATIQCDWTPLNIPQSYIKLRSSDPAVIELGSPNVYGNDGYRLEKCADNGSGLPTGAWVDFGVLKGRQTLAPTSYAEYVASGLNHYRMVALGYDASVNQTGQSRRISSYQSRVHMGYSSAQPTASFAPTYKGNWTIKSSVVSQKADHISTIGGVVLNGPVLNTGVVGDSCVLGRWYTNSFGTAGSVGDVNIGIRAEEWDLTDNDFLKFYVYVSAGDSLTNVRGVIANGWVSPTELNDSSFSNLLSSVFHIPGEKVTAQVGDRLVVEIGVVRNSSSTISAGRLLFTTTNDNLTQFDTSDGAAWLEFSLGPIAAGTPSMSASYSESSDTTTLSWADVENETTYEIQSTTDIAGAPDTASWSALASKAAGSTSHAIVGPPDGKRWYRIRGANGTDYGSWSSSVFVDAQATQPTWAAGCAYSYITNTTTLNWTAASRCHGYLIEKSANGTSGWTTVATVGLVTTNEHANSTNGVTYYRITALGNGGDSVVSANATVDTTPTTPTLSAGSGYDSANDRVVLTRNNTYSDTENASYLLEYSHDGGASWEPLASPWLTTGYTHQNPWASGLTYKVTLTTDGGSSSATASATCTRKIAVVSKARPSTEQTVLNLSEDFAVADVSAATFTVSIDGGAYNAATASLAAEPDTHRINIAHAAIDPLLPYSVSITGLIAEQDEAMPSTPWIISFAALVKLSTPNISGSPKYNQLDDKTYLTWPQVTNNNGYLVERSPSGSAGTFVFEADCPIDQNYYTKTAPPNGMSYYQVTAKGDSIGYATSAASSPLTVDTTPSSVVSASAEYLTSGQYANQMRLSCTPIGAAWSGLVYSWYWYNPDKLPVAGWELLHSGAETTIYQDNPLAGLLDYRVFVTTDGGTSTAYDFSQTCTRSVNLTHADRQLTTTTLLTFDLEVGIVSAQTAANYAIAGYAVSAAQKTEFNKVLLTHAAIPRLSSYTVDVGAVAGKRYEQIGTDTFDVPQLTKLSPPTWPTNPAGIVAWSHVSNTIVVNWVDANSNNHSSYELEWRKDGALQATVPLTKNITQWVHSNPPQGVLSYAIRALGDDEDFVTSDLTPVPRTDTPVLAKPTLDYDMTTDGEAIVTLNGSSSETVDEWLYWLSGNIAVDNDETDSTKGLYQINNQDIYEFTVQVRRGQIYSVPSEPVIIDAIIPDTPTLERPTFDGTDTHLVWSNVAAERGYRVQSFVLGNSWSDIDSNPDLDTLIDDTDLSHPRISGLATYRVQAESNVGPSGWSAPRAIITSPVLSHLSGFSFGTINGVGGNALVYPIPQIMIEGRTRLGGEDLWTHALYGQAAVHATYVFQVRMRKKIKTNDPENMTAGDDGWITIATRDQVGSGSTSLPEPIYFGDPGTTEGDAIWIETRTLRNGLVIDQEAYFDELSGYTKFNTIDPIKRFMLPENPISFGDGSLEVSLYTEYVTESMPLYDHIRDEVYTIPVGVSYLRYGTAEMPSTVTLDIPTLFAVDLLSATYDDINHRTTVSWSPEINDNAVGYRVDVAYDNDDNGMWDAWTEAGTTDADTFSLVHTYAENERKVARYRVVAIGDHTMHYDSNSSNVESIDTKPATPLTEDMSGMFDEDTAPGGRVTLGIDYPRAAAATSYNWRMNRYAADNPDDPLTTGVNESTAVTRDLTASEHHLATIIYEVPDVENGIVKFQVQAVTLGGPSNWSSEISIDTKADAVTNLAGAYFWEADPAKLDRTILTCDPVDDALCYYWYVENDKDAIAQIGGTSTVGTTINHLNPRYGANRYKVVAETTGGRGPYSTVTTINCARKLYIDSALRKSLTITRVAFNLDPVMAQAVDPTRWAVEGCTVNSVTRDTDDKSFLIAHSARADFAAYLVTAGGPGGTILGKKDEVLGTSEKTPTKGASFTIPFMQQLNTPDITSVFYHPEYDNLGALGGIEINWSSTQTLAVTNFFLQYRVTPPGGSVGSWTGVPVPGGTPGIKAPLSRIHTHPNPPNGLIEYRIQALGNNLDIGWSNWSNPAGRPEESVTPALSSPTAIPTVRSGTNYVDLTATTIAGESPYVTYRFFRTRIPSGGGAEYGEVEISNSVDTITDNSTYRYRAVAVRGSVQSQKGTPADVVPVTPNVPIITNAYFDYANNRVAVEYGHVDNETGYTLQKATSLISQNWDVANQVPCPAAGAPDPQIAYMAAPNSAIDYYIRIRAENTTFGSSAWGGDSNRNPWKLDPYIPAPGVVAELDNATGIVTVTASADPAYSAYVDEYKFYILDSGGQPIQILTGIEGDVCTYRLVSHGAYSFKASMRIKQVQSTICQTPAVVTTVAPSAPEIDQFDQTYKAEGFIRIKTTEPVIIHRWRNGQRSAMTLSVSAISGTAGTSLITLSTNNHDFVSGQFVTVSGVTGTHSGINGSRKIVDTGAMSLTLSLPYTLASDVNMSNLTTVKADRYGIAFGVMDFIDAIPSGDASMAGDWVYTVQSMVSNHFGQSLHSAMSVTNLAEGAPTHYFFTIDGERGLFPFPNENSLNLRPSVIVSRNEGTEIAPFRINVFVDDADKMSREYISSTSPFTIAESGKYFLTLDFDLIRVGPGEDIYVEFENLGGTEQDTVIFAYYADQTYLDTRWVFCLDLDVVQDEIESKVYMNYGVLNHPKYNSGVRGIRQSDIQLPVAPTINTNMLPTPQTFLSYASGKVNIKYSAVTDAFGYNLYVAKDGAEFPTNPTIHYVGSATVVEHILGKENDSAQHTYRFAVTAFNSLGESRKSAPWSCVYQQPATPVITKSDPDYTTGTFSLAISADNRVSGGGPVTAYEIFRNGAPIGSPFSPNESVAPFTHVYQSQKPMIVNGVVIIPGAVADTYTVRASNGAGDSLISAAVQIVNMPPDPPQLSFTGPSYSDGSVSVNASPSDTRTIKYNFYRRKMPTTTYGAPLNPEPMSNGNWTDNLNLPALRAGEYYYVAKAINISGMSNSSQEVRVLAEAPSFPQFVAMFSQGTGYVTLAATATNANTYTYWRRSTKNGVTTLTELNPNPEDKGLHGWTDSPEEIGDHTYFVVVENIFGSFTSAESVVSVDWVGKLMAKQGENNIYFGSRSHPVLMDGIDNPSRIDLYCSEKGKTDTDIIIDVEYPFVVSEAVNGTYSSSVNLGIIKTTIKSFFIKQLEPISVDHTSVGSNGQTTVPAMILGDLREYNVIIDTFVGATTVYPVSAAENTVTVGWDEATNADEYEVKYFSAGFPSWVSMPDKIRGTQATITGLVKGTDYQIKVLPWNIYNFGIESSPITVRTSGGPTKQMADMTTMQGAARVPAVFNFDSAATLPVVYAKSASQPTDVGLTVVYPTATTAFVQPGLAGTPRAIELNAGGMNPNFWDRDIFEMSMDMKVVHPTLTVCTNAVSPNVDAVTKVGIVHPKTGVILYTQPCMANMIFYGTTGKMSLNLGTAITYLTRASGSVTIEMAATTGFAVGNTIVVNSITDTDFNGIFTVTSMTATSLSYSQNGNNVARKAVLTGSAFTMVMPITGASYDALTGYFRDSTNGYLWRPSTVAAPQGETSVSGQLGSQHRIPGGATSTMTNQYGGFGIINGRWGIASCLQYHRGGNVLKVSRSANVATVTLSEGSIFGGNGVSAQSNSVSLVGCPQIANATYIITGKPAPNVITFANTGADMAETDTSGVFYSALYQWIDIGAPIPVPNTEYNVKLVMNAKAVKNAEGTGPLTWTGPDGFTYSESARVLPYINNTAYHPWRNDNRGLGLFGYTPAEDPNAGGWGGWMTGTWPGGGLLYPRFLTLSGASGITDGKMQIDNIKFRTETEI